MNVISLRNKIYCAGSVVEWLKTGPIGKYELAYPYISFENSEDATVFVLMFPDKEIPELRSYSYSSYIPLIGIDSVIIPIDKFKNGYLK